MHLPAVAVVDVGEGRRDAPFGHDGVRLPEQRLADQADPNTCRRGLDGGAQARAAGADHEHVVLVCRVRQKILQSVITPIEQRRTYRSAAPTMIRLAHAHWEWLQLNRHAASYSFSCVGCFEN